MTGHEFGVSSEIVGLDTEKILRTLDAHGVEYVLIGGLASIAHGSTLATADADVVPRSGVGNLARLIEALVSLDARLLMSERRLGMESGEPWEVTELRQGPQSLMASAAWHFTTSAGPIDVVMTATGVGTYEDHLGSVEEREAFGVRILVAGIDDLIASKEALQRPKDQAVLGELRELRDGGR